MMKIVYYTDQVYLHGGLERVISNKLNYLNEKTDIELNVITFQQKNQPVCYGMSDNVSFHDLGINYDRSLSFFHPINFKNVFKHFKKLNKIINKIDPDIVVVCNYEFGFYFMPLLCSNKILIKEYHSSRHFYYHNRQNNSSLIKKIMYKVVDFFESKYNYLALLNEDELNYYKSNNKIVIPNALSFFPDGISELSNNRVISAGRIAPVKGFEKLIMAWKIVNESYPNWNLDIYGDGEPSYVEVLEKQIKKIGLENKVTLKGATDNLKNEMLNASLYAMTSITECFPMVLLEAMSCGLPIVSFDSPTGPRNIIKDGVDGILVEYNDVEDLAREIIYLIKNPKQRFEMGIKAYKNVKRFSDEKIMNKWLNIFEYEKV
ncbi:glycosyltransferase family 4 protein [Aquimarina agarilytica]|uniref:glycosyltransferase family 4 protein n=1 Tax=Aquimarina agarilytica TaxID=1087449 RepID=UPI0002EA108E|nr:glycosyltransferase family 4 protein [Aquimarina agarilytica]